MHNFASYMAESQLLTVATLILMVVPFSTNVCRCYLDWSAGRILDRTCRIHVLRGERDRSRYGSWQLGPSSSSEWISSNSPHANHAKSSASERQNRPFAQMDVSEGECTTTVLTARGHEPDTESNPMIWLHVEVDPVIFLLLLSAVRVHLR